MKLSLGSLGAMRHAPVERTGRIRSHTDWLSQKQSNDPCSSADHRPAYCRIAYRMQDQGKSWNTYKNRLPSLRSSFAVGTKAVAGPGCLALVVHD